MPFVLSLEIVGCSWLPGAGLGLDGVRLEAHTRTVILTTIIHLCYPFFNR